MQWQQQGQRVIAPMLWVVEAISAIRASVYLGRVSLEAGQRAVDDLLDLGIETVPLDATLCRLAFEWAARLGQSKAYDGFYLALAEREGAELWTGDRRLANRAQQAGATWVRCAVE